MITAEEAKVLTRKAEGLMIDAMMQDDEIRGCILVDEYNDVVAKLLAFYGPHHSAVEIDPWLFEDYCNVYKAENGFKPRGHHYDAMRKYMDSANENVDNEA